MRSLPRNVLVCLLALAAAPAWSADEPKKLTKDDSIPGSFQAWMVTGKHAGRYHSPTTAHGLNPVVLIFARDLEGPDKPLFDLIKKLDQLAVQHPDARLGVCVVFLNDVGLREAIGRAGEEYRTKFREISPAKQTLEEQIRSTAKEQGIQKVEFGLDTAAGPRGYGIEEQKQITVLFYRDHTVLDRQAFAKDKFTEADVNRIVGTVTKTVTDLEKRLRRRR
jgi:hypothetical protein